MVRLKEREKEASVMSDERMLSKEQLELAAYFHWLDRGCPENDALTDWVEAEKKWGQTPWIAGEGDD